MAQVRGRVVSTVEGDEALEIIDRLAVKYTGDPFPMRSGVVFLIEVAKRPESRGLRFAVVLPDSGERYVSLPFFAY
jgi:cysteine synthase A